MILFKIGLLTLDRNCKAYANLIQLTATNGIITNFTAPIPDLDLTKDDCCNEKKLNKTKHLFTPANIGNVQLDDLTLASVKLHSIEEHIKTIETNRATNVSKGFHIAYIVYGLCTITLISLILKFSYFNQSINQFKPQSSTNIPLRRSSVDSKKRYTYDLNN